MWWDDGSLGWMGWACSLCDWCEYVIEERPQLPAFMAANSINLQVSYVLCKLSSHLCEYTHFVESLTSGKFSLHACYKPDISDLHSQEYKNYNLQGLTPCNMLLVLQTKNDITYQKAVILAQTRQWIVFLCLLTIDFWK
jgi:hypothetical protein